MVYGLYDQAANTLAGAGGNDTYCIGAGDSVTELPGGGIDTVQSGIDYVLAAEVENLVLTGATSINGAGNALANTLFAEAGLVEQHFPEMASVDGAAGEKGHTSAYPRVRVNSEM